MQFFRNPVTVYKDNQGAIALLVSIKIRPRTKHITIKHNKFWTCVNNGDVEIKHVYTKAQITDIFTKPIDYELFGYLHYKLNSR